MWEIKYQKKKEEKKSIFVSTVFLNKRSEKRNIKIEQSKPNYKNKWILIKSLFEWARKKTAQGEETRESTAQHSRLEESIKVNERKLALTLTANLAEC